MRVAERNIQLPRRVNRMVLSEERRMKSTRSMLEHAKIKVGIQINETYYSMCTICSSGWRIGP